MAKSKVNFFKKLSSQYVKSIVYGGLDGIITTFAVVSGVVGASLSPKIILILGFSNLIADGLSMGVGDYLSSKAEGEKEKEKPKTNRKPLIKLLEQHVTKPIAQKLSKVLERNTEVIKDSVLPCECEDEEDSPLWNGVTTFCSFAFFGFIPLLLFVVAQFVVSVGQYAFLGSAILTGITLAILGLVKAYATHTSYIRSAIETVIIGGLAAGVAFWIGHFVSTLV